MKILILGASGFIGNACLGFFRQDNEVIGVDLDNRKDQDVVCDEDGTATKNLIKEHTFDIIINCAGSANIQKSFNDPSADFDSNTGFVQRVLTFIKDFSPGTRFINISSASVYGNPVKLPVTEKDAVQPLSPYGYHKFLSEQLMKGYYECFNVQSLTVRIFSAYGVGLRQQLFYDLYQKLRSGSNDAELFGTGKESRDFINILDILQAFKVLINKGDFSGQVYNLACGEETTIKEASEIFSGILKYKGSIRFNNLQIVGYPANWKADISKIKVLGFEPRIGLADGLKKYAEWLSQEEKK